MNGQWYELSVLEDGSKASAEKVSVLGGDLQIDADRWELVLHRKGEMTLLSGGRDPLGIPAGKYDIMYCRRWSSPNDKGQQSWLMAMDKKFLEGKGAEHSITIAAGEKTTLPIGSPLSTSMTATLNGRTVKFSLEAPTIQPGVSVLMITSTEGGMSSRAKEPKVTLSDANGKVIDEFTMEYG